MTNVSTCEDSKLYMIPVGVQKMAHNGNELYVSVLLLPYWLLGIVFLAIGEIGEFLAYGLAPTLLISPLGTAVGNDLIKSLISLSVGDHVKQ
jgi:hypothetical protein